MKELNEKLARWAGFRKQVLEDLAPIVRHEANLGWSFPDGTTTRWLMPDFTTDLNAQVKWLWPKLPYVVLENCQGGYMATVSKDMLNQIEVIDANPGLALCKAIEQLIDKEKK